MLSLFLTSTVVEDPPWLKKFKGAGIKIDYIGLSLIVLGIGCLQVILDKGQQDDWFGSNFITTFAIIAAVALVTLVIHEWRTPHPILELKLLKNRNFAATVLFNFVLGAVLFGTTVLIPQFLQLMMGYSAEKAGEVLSPAGFMLMVLFPIAGHTLHQGRSALDDRRRLRHDRRSRSITSPISAWRSTSAPSCSGACTRCQAWPSSSFPSAS